MIVVAGLLALGVAVFFLIKYRKFFELSWSLPGPKAFPIIGNALSFLCNNEDIFKIATSISSNYPSPLRFWFGSKLTVVITDVHQAEKIMSSVKFITKDDIYRFIEVIDGKGLITASGPKWKKDRRLMAPLFLKRNTSQYFNCILSHSKKLVQVLERFVDQPTFNVNLFIHRCVADFVNETVVGAKTNIQFGEMEELLCHVKKMYTLIHARMTKVWLQNDFLFKFSPYWREYNEGVRYIHGFLKKVLRENEEKHTISNDCATFKPIIHHLIDIRREITDFATDEEMIHHLATLYSAAEDTVQSITSFTLVLLGMYPDIQKKVYEEISNILHENRDIEESDLGKLEYLDMVIKDVLRLFPIAPFIVRKSNEDFQLDGKIIPKNCSIVVSIQNIHRNKKYWERPDDFHPEHFLPENVRKRHPYAFMPFSAGPRGCIGKSYAYMAMKILIVTLLKDYVVESDGSKLQDKELKMDISVRFKDDNYPVRLKKRY